MKEIQIVIFFNHIYFYIHVFIAIVLCGNISVSFLNNLPVSSSPVFYFIYSYSFISSSLLKFKINV